MAQRDRSHKRSVYNAVRLMSRSRILTQEMDRFNHLRRVVASSCSELQRAVKGLAVMSAEMEDMATALANNQVPRVWARAAYPSLKPLAAWVRDFTQRMEFMETWVTEGQPSVFWLPGFFFPQVCGVCVCVLRYHHIHATRRAM